MKLLIMVIYLSVMLLFTPAAQADSTEHHLLKGVVLSAEGFDEDQRLTIELLDSPFQGHSLTINGNLLTKTGQTVSLHAGTKVMLVVEGTANRVENAYLYDIARADHLSVLMLAFVVLMLLVGAGKGLRALLSLLLSGVLILFVLLPLVLNGADPLLSTILVMSLVTILTLLIISGFTRKTGAAILGTIAGVSFAAVLSVYAGEALRLTGLIAEEAQELFFMPGYSLTNFQGLLFSQIIIGALGATMDVSMSIASSIAEVRRSNPGASILDLLHSGMNVGRDVMGTMANTLVLAYVGSSMPLMLLLMANHTSLPMLLNSEVLATEAVRAIAGTTGLILTVPITSSLAASLLVKEKQRVRRIARR